MAWQILRLMGIATVFLAAGLAAAAAVAADPTEI